MTKTSKNEPESRVIYNSRELSIIAKIRPKPFSKEDLDFLKDMGFDVRKVSIDYNGAKD